MKLVAFFAEKDVWLKAVDTLRAPWAPLEMISPYEVGETLPEFESSLALNWVKAAALGGAVTALVVVLGVCYYANVIDSPLNVGGRPLNSWPTSIPIAFVLTVLATGLATFAAWMICLRLPWPHHPAFAVIDLSKPDFYLLFEKPEGRDDAERLLTKLREAGAFKIAEVPA